MTMRFYLFLCFLSRVHSNSNPVIGILTESNIYLAQILEFNHTEDDLRLIYHHHDPVYMLQSFTTNHFNRKLYICSPTTIYTLDSTIGSTLVPLVPIDDTPCRSSLTFVSMNSSLLWILHRTVIELNFMDMSRNRVWNTTATILEMTLNQTINNDNDERIMYLSVEIADRQSAIVRCRFRHIFPFESCLFIDSGHREITALAIDGHRLFVADRFEQRIYALTLTPNGIVKHKEILPLNTSIVADIQSMFIHDVYLVWVTTHGHVRIVSLLDWHVRSLFWIDDTLRTVRLLSFGQWSNRTLTTPSSTSSYSTSKKTNADSTTKPILNENPWKATAYITSILMGIAFFLCAAMVTFVLLNYRLGRGVPSSFTNVLHFLRHRTWTTSETGNDRTLTLSMN